MTSLDKQLRIAHQNGDGAALVQLYVAAAAQAADVDAEAFYLTHAHVFALEWGHARTGELRQRLIDLGREVPLDQAPAARP